MGKENICGNNEQKGEVFEGMWARQHQYFTKMQQETIQFRRKISTFGRGPENIGTDTSLAILG